MLGEVMHGMVRMQPLLFQVHLFFLCFSQLPSGAAAGPDSGSGLGLPHSSTSDMVRELQDPQHAELEKRLFWTEIYVPVRRCHAILKNKKGEFSVPVIRNRRFKNIWCNWTIWAGPRNHIIIYVQGFRGSKDCKENADKIIFESVASIMESTIAYACWNKRVHVYASQALAVNVALLLNNYTWNQRYKYFRGKYYIFRDPRERTLEKGDLTYKVPLQRPSCKLTYSSTGLKVELPVGTSQRGLEVTSPEPMPSKDLQPEGSFTWGREEVEFSEISLPYLFPLNSERLSGKSQVDSIISTKTLDVGEMSLGDGLFFKALGKTAALDIRWLEITQEKNILSLGSTMDGSTVDLDILYENTPYLVSPTPSTTMGDESINIKSERVDNQTDYLIPTSEDATINIKPIPISHSILGILSDTEFLEKTKYSKNEKIQISPSQIRSSLSGSEQQSFLQTEVLTQEALTISTDSMEIHISSIDLAYETQFPLEGSLHSIPVVPTVHTAMDFSPKSSQEIFSDMGFMLMVTSLDGRGLVPELPSTISIRSTEVRTEAEPELLQTARSLPGLAETESLSSCVISEEAPSRHQMSLAESYLKFVVSQERFLPFTTYQENLSDVELTLTPSQVIKSVSVSEWVLQKIPVSIPSVYHSEQVSTEQTLGIPLTLTQGAMLKAKQPSMTPFETRTEIDSMLVVQSITTPFGSVHHEEESMAATVFSFGIPLSHHPNFSKSNMECYFSNPTAESLAFLPTPTPSINEDKHTLRSLSSHSWTDPGEMFSSVGKTEPLPLFALKNVGVTTSESSPRRLGLSVKNFFDPLEGESLIEKGTQSISQLVSKDNFSQGRDASSGSKISLVSKTYSKMTLLSALQSIPSSAMTISWKPDEIQTEMTVQPSKKDETVNKSKPWKPFNSFGQNQNLAKANFISLFPSVPSMSLGKWDQTGDLPAVSSSPPLWSKDTDLLEAKNLQDSEIFTPSSMVAYLPIRRCHVVLEDTFGTFSLPEDLSTSWPNIWCNWTIWAGTKKHIIVYIKGFEGPENCDESQDKIIFQGVSSSVERKIFYACRKQGTLTFATQALAVHIVFLSMRSYPRHIPSFEGEYFIFTDPERQVPPKSVFGSSQATSQRLRERSPSSLNSHPDLVSKLSFGSFPNMNSICTGLEDKRQIVTETLIMKNKELVERERKGLERKQLCGFLPLIPTKGPLIMNKNPSPLLIRQKLSRSIDSIKNSVQRDSAVRMALIPNILYEHKPENKATQGDLPVDSLLIYSHWPSKTLPLTKLLPKPAGISDRLLPSAIVQEQRLSWSSAEAESLALQGDLDITRSSNFYSHLMAQSIRKPQDAVNHRDHLYQSFSHVKLVKEKNFLEAMSGGDELTVDTLNIPKEELSSNLLFNVKQLDPESSAASKERGGEMFSTKLVSKGVNLDPTQFITLQNLSEELQGPESSRRVTMSNGFVRDSISSGSLADLSSFMKTLHTPQNFFREVTDDFQPSTAGADTSPSVPNFQAKEGLQTKALLSLSPDQVWKNMTTEGVLVLTPGYPDARTTSQSFGNGSALDFQHYPGDILLEVTIETEYPVKSLHNASEVEKVLVDLFKQEIEENLGHFSPETDAFKLTRIKRKDTSNVMFVFWLHLMSRGRNISNYLMPQFGASLSSTLHSQLRTLIRDAIEALQIHLKSISIDDVNECETGLEHCGEGAECFNGVGTYICHCKEDHEDRSPMQTGILCVHVPHSGVGFSFNYLDLVISASVFATIIIILIIGLVWQAMRTTQEKKDFCLQETASLEGLSSSPLTQTKPYFNLKKFNKYSLYNPYQPKPQARVIDDSLEDISYLSKDSHVWVEQSKEL
ncbi:uncharacterized protein LOC103092736 isoform X2 [Monodelphis domestica]|uniref:uncharacterized protein LOC103092736 isoform X2 n=1 Tax=Monodelphis domestica TaxID=13616 RepID=UPI000443168D|nr:uncharacterized protein LOC103092736 isoform X2 [Monodelphis domestica]